MTKTRDDTHWTCLCVFVFCTSVLVVEYRGSEQSEEVVVTQDVTYLYVDPTLHAATEHSPCISNGRTYRLEIYPSLLAYPADIAGTYAYIPEIT